MRLCWNAQAVAPLRLDAPTLSKMLLTCRATVFSLMNSSSAMARLVLPAASRRRTCSSRSLSKPGRWTPARSELLLHPREARLGVQLLEQPPRGIKIEPMAILIAPALTPRRHQDTRFRFFRGDVHILP